jgi:hypothetical protein
MFNAIRKLFHPRAAEALAAQELENAQRELLEAQSAREYAAAMVTYHEARITRLQAVLRKDPPPRPELDPAAALAARAALLKSINLPSSVPHGY